MVFGINDEEIATAKRFLEKNHPDLATLHDPQDKVHKMYGAYSIPTVLVIDPSGRIVAHFIGERPETDFSRSLKTSRYELIESYGVCNFHTVNWTEAFTC